MENFRKLCAYFVLSERSSSESSEKDRKFFNIPAIN